MVYHNGIDIKLLVCVYILSHTRGLQLLLFPLPWFYKCSIGRNSLGCGMDVGSKGAPLSFERCWQCICWSVPICSTGRQCRPADTSFLATSSAPTVEYQGCEWLEEGTQWAYLWDPSCQGTLLHISQWLQSTFQGFLSFVSHTWLCTCFCCYPLCSL